MGDALKLLGTLEFVSRTFEGDFKDNPFVLDGDANLYVGPADHVSRDEHAAIEVVFHFLSQTGREVAPIRALLRNRIALLNAFASFDHARGAADRDEFRITFFGTYDGEPLVPVEDDDLPAGPCGKTINETKRRLYELCRRSDPEFDTRPLTEAQQRYERRFWSR